MQNAFHNLNANNLIEIITAQQLETIVMVAGATPVCKRGLHSVHVDGLPMLSSESISMLLSELKNMHSNEKRQLKSLPDENLDLTFSLGLKGIGRFRVHSFYQRGSIALMIQRFQDKVPSVEDIHLPASIVEFAMGSPYEPGLAIITGPEIEFVNRSLASAVSHRAQNVCGYIITFENPIMYMLSHNKSVVAQREIGIDIDTGDSVSTHALSQPADLIVINNISSKSSIHDLMKIVEAGGRCLITMRSPSAKKALLTLINAFSTNESNYIYNLLADNLKCIIGQSSIEGTDGIPIPIYEELIINKVFTDEMKSKQAVPKFKTDTNGSDFNKTTPNRNTMGIYSGFDYCIAKRVYSGHIDKDNALKRIKNTPQWLMMELQKIEHNTKNQPA